MTPLATVLVLGLVNWVATTILVESELFAPVRRWVHRRAAETSRAARLEARRFAEEVGTQRELGKATRRRAVWDKLGYLVDCHLCAGTWVGFVLAAVAGGPFAGWAAVALNGLAYKAVGHLTLAAVNRLNR